MQHPFCVMCAGPVENVKACNAAPILCDVCRCCKEHVKACNVAAVLSDVCRCGGWSQ